MKTLNILLICFTLFVYIQAFEETNSKEEIELEKSDDDFELSDPVYLKKKLGCVKLCKAVQRKCSVISYFGYGRKEVNCKSIFKKCLKWCLKNKKEDDEEMDEENDNDLAEMSDPRYFKKKLKCLKRCIVVKKKCLFKAYNGYGWKKISKSFCVVKFKKCLKWCLKNKNDDDDDDNDDDDDKIKQLNDEELEELSDPRYLKKIFKCAKLCKVVKKKCLLKLKYYGLFGRKQIKCLLKFKKCVKWCKKNKKWDEQMEEENDEDFKEWQQHS